MAEGLLHVGWFLVAHKLDLHLADFWDGLLQRRSLGQLSCQLTRELKLDRGILSNEGATSSR